MFDDLLTSYGLGFRVKVILLALEYLAHSEVVGECRFLGNVLGRVSIEHVALSTSER